MLAKYFILWLSVGNVPKRFALIASSPFEVNFLNLLEQQHLYLHQVIFSALLEERYRVPDICVSFKLCYFALIAFVLVFALLEFHVKRFSFLH